MKLHELIGGALRSRTQRNGDPENGLPRPARHVIGLCKMLLSERGESSGERIAAEALAAYQALDDASRAIFFDLLIQQFSPDAEEVARAAEAYRQNRSASTLAHLQDVVEPPRQHLFRRLNMAPGGTQTLVSMRAQLLARKEQNPKWEPIESDLQHLLNSWFNRGFLELRRIDWSTPAIILEKLIEYEAVHEIQGWEDLRRRLEADRRCYAFFHPALKDEPIIFVEVALTRGMSARVQPLLDLKAPVLNPRTANCAVFYSITNCQEGLRGVPLGSFLIKKVAEDIGRELRYVRTFATISPVTGFREWVEGMAHEHKEIPTLVSKLASGAAGPSIEKELLALCAFYLLHIRHGKKPTDPVARFHLRNGARLDRINWHGDTSPAGLERS
ncbi:MAG TPA: malonyl-CoA decarboxylase family protein, partial [Bryobacteraceae bacterium]